MIKKAIVLGALALSVTVNVNAQQEVKFDELIPLPTLVEEFEEKGDMTDLYHMFLRCAGDYFALYVVFDDAGQPEAENFLVAALELKGHAAMVLEGQYEMRNGSKPDEEQKARIAERIEEASIRHGLLVSKKMGYNWQTKGDMFASDEALKTEFSTCKPIYNLEFSQFKD